MCVCVWCAGAIVSELRLREVAQRGRDSRRAFDECTGTSAPMIRRGAEPRDPWRNVVTDGYVLLLHTWGHEEM